MLIRRATKSDLPLIHDLETLIFSGRDELFSRDQLRYLLSTPNSVVLVCLADSRPIGYGIALVNKLRNGELKGRIYSIGLLREWQNRGIGTAFVRELEKSLISAGVAFIALETRTDRKGAEGFFERMGYHVTANLPGYYGTSAGVRMIKVIKEGYRPRRR